MLLSPDAAPLYAKRRKPQANLLEEGSAARCTARPRGPAKGPAQADTPTQRRSHPSRLEVRSFRGERSRTASWAGADGSLAADHMVRGAGQPCCKVDSGDGPRSSCSQAQSWACHAIWLANARTGFVRGAGAKRLRAGGDGKPAIGAKPSPPHIFSVAPRHLCGATPPDIT
jgi:hypothetical protein